MTEEFLNEAYRRAGVERSGKFFRFPNLNRGGTEEREKELQNYLLDKGFSKPGFENIGYDWYYKFGEHEYVDVGCTFDTKDYMLFEEGEPDTIDELLERFERDEPGKGLGLNYEGSNDILMMHDHPFSDRELSNKAFYAIIDRLDEKNIEVVLPGN